MSRRAAAVTQADIERVCRAARRQGAARVTVKVGEALFEIDLRDPAAKPPKTTAPPIDEPEVVDL